MLRWTAVFLQAHQGILQIIAILSVLHCLLQKIANSTEYKLKYVISIKKICITVSEPQFISQRLFVLFTFVYAFKKFHSVVF